MDIFAERKGFTPFHLVLVIIALMAVLYALGALKGLENKAYDSWLGLRGPRPASDQVILVAIDDETVNAIGAPTKWRRDRYATLLDQLAKAKAKVIGMDVIFAGDEDEEKAGNNKKLTDAVRACGNVVLAFSFEQFGQPVQGKIPEGAEKSALPKFVSQDTFYFPQAATASWPFDELIAASAAIGHTNSFPDGDGRLRSYALVGGHKGRYFPHLALQIARLFFDGTPDDIAPGPFTIDLKGRAIPADDAGRMLVSYQGRQTAVKKISFKTVLDGNFDPSVFAGKIVVVGSTYKGLDKLDLLPTPLYKETPGVEILATVVDNIVMGDFLRGRGSLGFVNIGMFILAAAASALAFPRLRARHTVWIAAGLVLLIFFVAGLLFIGSNIWLNSVYPAATVALAFIGATVLGYAKAEKKAETATDKEREATKLLGLSFQEKGMLDMALQTFQKLKPSGDLKDVYFSLGLDYENKGFADKAFYVYKKVFEMDSNYEDVAERMRNLRERGLHTVGVGHPTVSPLIQTTSTPFPGQLEPSPAPAASAPDSTMDIHQPAASTAASGIPAAAEATADFTRAGPPHAPASAPPAAPPPQPVAPTPASVEILGKINKYEVVKKLGKGAMGEVYQVRDPVIGRLAALKTIRPDIELSPKEMIEMKQRFYREAQTAGKISHPNVVTIYDVDEFQGISYIVMEFVEGMTLRDVIKRKVALKQNQIKSIITQAAMALDAAHKHGVYHRDVKPDNIMVTKDLRVKVMDFGIARVAESNMTKTGSVLGTPAYMSPEQVNGKKVDGRSDVFSLGVCLYELLTGVAPFRGDTLTKILIGIIKDTPPPPSEVGQSIPSAWDPVVAKVLEKDPEQRYPSAADFAAAVSAVGTK